MVWRYDAEQAPDAERWLACDEQERVSAVVHFHRGLKAGHAHLSSPQAHAAMHVVVENQLAQDQPYAVRVTMNRLLEEGLNRHEVIHAIGEVASRRLFAVLQKKVPWDQDAYVQELNRLTASAAFASVRESN